MSNFFEQVANDASQVEEELLGPNYKYWSYINTPSEMGMSSRGSLSQIGTNIGGLINYAELLVAGTGGASKTGKPLGPRFFLRTGQKCKSKTDGQMTTRYIYMDQQPTGNIPFISSGLGVNFSEFRGLVPGTFSNLNSLNPMTIFSAFMEDANPECQELTMETTPSDINNFQTTQTEFVTTNDIRGMDPCIFSLNGNKNPITGESCREAFENLNQLDKNLKEKDYLVQMFYGAFGIFGLYLLFKFMEKNNLIKVK